MRRYDLGVKNLHDSTLYLIDSKDTNAKFIQTIQDAFSDEQNFPVDELRSFPKETIVSYLMKTHEFYLNTMIPEIEQQFIQLMHHARYESPFVLKLYNDFEQYRIELKTHITFEEETLFPLILKKENPSKCLVNSILEAAHHQHEDDLALILETLIKETKRFEGQMPYYILIEKLILLSKDLVVHARIEDDVLMA